MSTYTHESKEYDPVEQRDEAPGCRTKEYVPLTLRIWMLALFAVLCVGTMGALEALVRSGWKDEVSGSIMRRAAVEDAKPTMIVSRVVYARQVEVSEPRHDHGRL